MPRSKSNDSPRYLLHKATGQARVIIDGKTHYLGAYESPASIEKYNRLVAEYLNNGRRLPPPTTSPTGGDRNAISIAEVVGVIAAERLESESRFSRSRSARRSAAVW